VCLAWRQWTETSVWFDDVGISAFHSCVVVDLWQSLSEWRLLLSECVLVCHRENVGARIRALSVRMILASKQINVLEHPPYSPDLAPSDFSLFPKIKKTLIGRHLVTLMTSGLIRRQLWRPFHKTSSKIVLKGGLGAGIGAEILKGITLNATTLTFSKEVCRIFTRWVRELYCQITYLLWTKIWILWERGATHTGLCSRRWRVSFNSSFYEWDAFLAKMVYVITSRTNIIRIYGNMEQCILCTHRRVITEGKTHSWVL
jgi:histone-lysine N-methyltransferase SETMAR